MTDELAEIRQKKLEELRNGERGTAAENRSNESPDDPVHVHGAQELQNTVDDGVVLVDFYAEWCGPCKQLEPVVERIAASTAATVAKVDIDANQQAAATYGIRSVPTLLLFADGEPVERLVGMQQEPQLRSLIESYA
ncbi:thioredoxin [Haloarcula vallismortis]|uniref:Thioredoxin n=2 Tax=Haloarcula vallismortis TaxID=28442 RepID=M0J7M6_HALVA|nr:thioredoxin [Haloarcula vallismortis]EMA05132.1 thioredoxin [Haloarcula vallismortis ATCC 29715]SDX14223.1 thioredoxin [Haloarcula vallismortis]